LPEEVAFTEFRIKISPAAIIEKSQQKMTWDRGAGLTLHPKLIGHFQRELSTGHGSRAVNLVDTAPLSLTDFR
jgi:hypothetical protein